MNIGMRILAAAVLSAAISLPASAIGGPGVPPPPGAPKTPGYQAPVPPAPRAPREGRGPRPNNNGPREGGFRRNGQGGRPQGGRGPARDAAPRVWQPKAPAKSDNLSFEDMMSRFKSQSEEKMADLDHETNNRRGGGYAPRGRRGSR